MKNLRRLTLIATGILAAALVTFATGRRAAPGDNPAGYSVTARVPLPGSGGWDYLSIDTAHHHLFISNTNQIVVVDTRKNTVAGTIPTGPETHGVGVAEKDNHGFTSNSGNDTGATIPADGRSMASSTFTEFDLRTLRVMQQVALPIAGSDGIIYDPYTDRIFAFTHTLKGVAVDAATGSVAGTIDLPGEAEFAVSDGAGHIYDNIESKSTLIEIDAKSLAVTHEWPLAPCESPSGLAMDTQSRRLFVGCRNQMMAIVNADTGQVVTTEPIGVGVDADRFDPGTKLAFASTGDGFITVVHEDTPDTYTVVGKIATEQGARTMEVDPETHTLYTVTAKFASAPAPPESQGAPAPGAGRGRGGRRQMVPGSFTLLVVTQTH